MPDTRLIGVTDVPCAKAPVVMSNDEPPQQIFPTHHLLPVHGEMLCTYCRRTERQIRKLTPILHRGVRCRCYECGKHPDDVRCIHCHLALNVHPNRDQ